MKNKILIISGIFSPDIGGPARILDKLIRDLISKDFIVSVLTSAPHESVKYPYKIFRVSRGLFKPLRFFLSLVLGFILSLSVDILYVVDIYSAGQAHLAKKFLGKKMIIRFVSDPVWDTAIDKGWIQDSFQKFQNKTYNKRIERLKKRRDRILKSADKIITVSHVLEEHLLKIGIPKSKIKVIYNSVEKLEFEPLKSVEEIKQELGVTGKLLITTPRLVPWKKVDVLIKCIKELSNCSLIILGEGTEKNMIEELIKKDNLNNKVFLLGKKLGQDYINYMNAADVFVYNTSYEGMSHALLDAMQMNKPIITTSIPANKEIIEHEKDGLLVEYDNFDQWIKAIRKMLDDEEINKKMVAHYKAKLGRFNWDQMVEKTIEVIKGVCNSGL